MKAFFIIFISISTLLIGCVSLKKLMVSNGTTNDAIKNAITDFLHTNKFDKTDSVFSISTQDIKGEILGISISKESNKIAVITEDKINYSYKAFPTNYFEQGGKLFYWKDSSRNVSLDLINKLSKMNRIDPAIIGSFFPIRINDDTQKAMHYYFCKNNLFLYKKVYTNIAMGWYDIPKLNCN